MSKASKWAKDLSDAGIAIKTVTDATPQGHDVNSMQFRVQNDGGLNISQGGQMTLLEAKALGQWIEDTFGEVQ